MAVAPWPSAPPVYLLPWVIWRFLGSVVADRPVTAPKLIPVWAQGFLKWVAWKRKGSDPATRPTGIPTKIPQWAWPILRQVNIAVPVTPPPPPPPPANPVPPNSWKLRMPVMYTAHGWLLDSAFRDTDHALQLMAQSGVGTVALQAGMFLDDTGDRVRAFGMDVAVWGSADSRDAQYLAQAQAQGYIPQIEGYFEYERAVANLEAGVGAGLSLSIVTTCAGLDTFTTRPNGTAEGEMTTVEAERIIAAGCTHAQVECYLWDMSPSSIPAGIFEVKHRGMYYAVPCLSYLAIVATGYARQVAVFLAEPMSDAQYAQLGGL